MSSDKTSLLLVFCGLVFGCFLTFTAHYLLGPRISIYGNIMQIGSSNKSDEKVETWLTNTTLSNVQKLQEEKQKLQNMMQEIDKKLAISEKGLPKIQEKILEGNNTKKTSINAQTRSSYGSRAPTESGVEKKSSNGCKYDFKVFVYDIPQSLNSIKISEEARRNQSLHICQKCILEQFALEYIIYDFFTQFCGRTTNPEEADFFYLPLVRDAEFRWKMQNKGVRSRAPSNAEEAILLMIEKGDSNLWNKTFKVSDKYYKRSGGGDHIIVMPAPVTNLRHQSSQRGFFHYMIHLTTPIFLGLEYTKGFIREYPVCSSRKNIVMPYPTTDPDLYNGKFSHIRDQRKSHIDRSFLFYYTGGVHGDCVEIRKAMKQLVVNSSRTKLADDDHLQGLCPPSVKSGQAQRERGFQSAIFCPIPIGDSPSSKRMYDSLNFGCIPVVLSDDLVWAFSRQTGGPLNHSQFSIHIPQSVIQFTAGKTLEMYSERKEDLGVLPSTGKLLYDLLESSLQQGGEYIQGTFVNPMVQILQKIPIADIQHLQHNIAKVAPLMRYYAMNQSMSSIPTASHLFPDGGAVDLLGDLLSRRKREGLKSVQKQCQEERNRKGHRYESRYTCDSDKTRSLIKRRT